jgi:hypothetical protein
LRLSTGFDIPDEVSRGPHSPAFGEFLWNWFGDTLALTHGELDITFLNDLTPAELDCAREMIRRNLKLRYVHIIQGVSALRDVDSAPILRAMIEDEHEESRRLTMAGALWKITRDPVFPELLERAKQSGNAGLISAHLFQVLWLDDERSIDFLIELLPERDYEPLAWRALERIAFAMPFGRLNPLRRLLLRSHHRHHQAQFHTFLAWSLLNQLEFGGRTENVPREKWRSPSEYRRLQHDAIFRQSMATAVHRWNAQSTNGR